MIRIGIIGLGFMGMIHYYGAKKVDGCQVTAICTRDPQKLSGDWSSIQGNFGPRGGMEMPYRHGLPRGLPAGHTRLPPPRQGPGQMGEMVERRNLRRRGHQW